MNLTSGWPSRSKDCRPLQVASEDQDREEGGRRPRVRHHRRRPELQQRHQVSVL